MNISAPGKWFRFDNNCRSDSVRHDINMSDVFRWQKICFFFLWEIGFYELSKIDVTSSEKTHCTIDGVRCTKQKWRKKITNSGQSISNHELCSSIDVQCLRLWQFVYLKDLHGCGLTLLIGYRFYRKIGKRKQTHRTKAIIWLCVKNHNMYSFCLFCPTHLIPCNQIYGTLQKDDIAFRAEI